MNQLLEAPFLELQESFPDELYVLNHPESGRYGCYCHEGIHGLACFSTENGAFRFTEFINLTGMVPVETTFEEAREIAKGRPMPIVSLMLLDHIHAPRIHYVR